MEENKEKMSPELEDIMNRVRAFHTVNPDANFVFAFLGWKKDEEVDVCEDCGKKHCCPDETKTVFSGFGDLDTLRQLNNDLRDFIEDSSDKRGCVSF